MCVIIVVFIRETYSEEVSKKWANLDSSIDKQFIDGDNDYLFFIVITNIT